MKNLFYILLLSPLFLFGQTPTFNLSEENPTINQQYIVLDIENLPITTGYNRVLEWVNVTYNTPSQVIKSQLENKYIRIEGVSNGGYINRTGMGLIGHLNAKYMIEFRFQDNRVKCEIISTELWGPATGWVSWNMEHSKMYRRNGKPNKNYIIGVNSLLKIFNDLALNLNSFLTEPTEGTTREEDNW